MRFPKQIHTIHNTTASIMCVCNVIGNFWMGVTTVKCTNKSLTSSQCYYFTIYYAFIEYSSKWKCNIYDQLIPQVRWRRRPHPPSTISIHIPCVIHTFAQQYNVCAKFVFFFHFLNQNFRRKKSSSGNINNNENHNYIQFFCFCGGTSWWRCVTHTELITYAHTHSP